MSVSYSNLANLAYKVQQYPSRMVFNISRRPIIPFKIRGSQGWISVEALADTGNDITLISEATARQAGIDYQKEGTPFQVSGVGGGAHRYYMVRRLVQIGDLRPRVFRIGIGDPPVNLLGREDLSAYYRLTFEGTNKIVFEELEIKAANVTTASGIGFRQQKFFRGERRW
jgi:hypothetical protein